MAFIWIEKTEEKQEFFGEQEKTIQSSVLAVKKKKKDVDSYSEPMGKCQEGIWV